MLSIIMCASHSESYGGPADLHCIGNLHCNFLGQLFSVALCCHNTLVLTLIFNHWGICSLAGSLCKGSHAPSFLSWSNRVSTPYCGCF